MRSSSSAFRQVLRFVHDKQRPAALALGGVEEVLQPKQDAALVGRQVLEPESGGDHAQQVMARQAGGDDMGGDDLAGIYGGDQALDQGGLARADIARDDDEAFASLQPVGEMRPGLGMNAPFKIDSLVRLQQEGLGP